jgi:hypothetical protein
VTTKDAGPSQEGTGESQRGTGESQQGTALPGPRAQARRLLGGFRGLVGRHLIFSVALLAALVPRVVAMLGYRPAVLFPMDTFDYLWGAVHPSPNVINPSGYSLFLWLIRPFHSFALVAALQHLIGLGIGVMVYAVLRRYGLPAWGATLAAAPVLFDPAQILIEQMVMADLLAMALMVAAFTILLLAERASLWWLVTAGLLMGISAIVRPTTLPLILLIAVYLLIRRAGWRRAGATLAAGIIPVAAYMGWFDSVHGSFNMTNSNGLFLWTRTMSFANCAVINPPRDLRALCPQAQPGRLSQPVPSKRLQPKNYLWTRASWQWKPRSHQFVPDTAAFTPANNSRALRFALDAITAQPFAYASVVLKESMKPFISTNSLRFPGMTQRVVFPPPPGDMAYAAAAVREYSRGTVPVPHTPYPRYAAQVHQPYVSFMTGYQRVIYLPPPVLGLVTLIGLAGILIPRRRSAAAVLLWVSAVIVMVLPIAEHEYTYRYVIAAVPLLCIAAALALRKPAREKRSADPPASADRPVAGSQVNT